MDKNLEKAIIMAFDAPVPDRKKRFLQEVSYRSMQKDTWYQLIYSQIGYIHKGVWICAAAVFCAVLYFFSHQDSNTIFLSGALTPFLALAVLIESSRSYRYNMAELEAATRYSLRSAFFSKMLILGIFDLIVLLLIIIMIWVHSKIDLLLTSAYILLPYLLTMWLGMTVELTHIGRERPYAAVGLSLVISAVMFVLSGRNVRILRPDHGIWWEFMTAVMVIGIIRRGKDKLAQMEEPLWN